jgi:hypothetical protein
MKLKTSEQAWSGCYIEKKDEIQNEGEGKESLKMVWGEGRQKEEALLRNCKFLPVF